MAKQTKGGNRVGLGDSAELVAQLEPNSIHAVVTDPPY